MVEPALLHPTFVFFLGLPALAIAFCIIAVVFGRLLTNSTRAFFGKD